MFQFHFACRKKNLPKTLAQFWEDYIRPICSHSAELNIKRTHFQHGDFTDYTDIRIIAQSTIDDRTPKLVQIPQILSEMKLWIFPSVLSIRSRRAKGPWAKFGIVHQIPTCDPCYNQSARCHPNRWENRIQVHEYMYSFHRYTCTHSRIRTLRIVDEKPRK